MGRFKTWKEKLYVKLRRTLHIEHMDIKLAHIHSLGIEKYLEDNLYNNPRYDSPDKLTRFEKQVFSQFGEDGIIQEIFRRIGTTNQYFVEFGVEDGSETNSTYLLYKGWRGLWIDGNKEHMATIHRNCANAIAKEQLTAIESFITAENIESLFSRANVPEEPDLLSIDIDRNDYHVWKAITHYKPRVVVIEYNGIFPPGDEFVVAYDANAWWDTSSNYGASLESLTRLGESKGYKLVCCTFAGLNAFFIREDLIKDHFTGPFTVENHYERPRYFLLTKNGHPRKAVF
jgi:hypothetical protein